MRFILCTWFSEFCSCCSLTALPGPAWVLHNWICKELISSLYLFTQHAVSGRAHYVIWLRWYAEAPPPPLPAPYLEWKWDNYRSHYMRSTPFKVPEIGSHFAVQVTVRELEYVWTGVWRNKPAEFLPSAINMNERSEWYVTCAQFYQITYWHRANRPRPFSKWHQRDLPTSMPPW